MMAAAMLFVFLIEVLKTSSDRAQGFPQMLAFKHLGLLPIA